MGKRGAGKGNVMTKLLCLDGEAGTSPNSAAALEFLGHFSKPPWQLTAIDPDRSKGSPLQFCWAETQEQALAFLGEWNGKRNIYFAINLPATKMETKAKKEHIKEVRFLQLDTGAEISMSIT